MKNLLLKINTYIKEKKLTEKLTVISDGAFYKLVYSNFFGPKDIFETVAKLSCNSDQTIKDLKKWLDAEISKPRD